MDARYVFHWADDNTEIHGLGDVQLAVCPRKGDICEFGTDRGEQVLLLQVLAVKHVCISAAGARFEGPLINHFVYLFCKRLSETVPANYQ